MKKLALASAIAAATLVSTGAHALTGSIYLTIPNPDLDITIDCALTPYGGTSVMYYNGNPDTLSGTICLAPSGPSNYPYVLLDIALFSRTGAGGGGTHMTGGGIAIYTDTASSTATNWAYVSTQPGASISCPGLTPSATPPLNACSANLLGMPADLYLN
jgi:hypothetical protein